MPDVLPIYDSAPRFTFDQSLAANTESVDVNYERLRSALGSIGVTAENASEAAVHVANIGSHKHFGVHLEGSKFINSMMRVPFFNREPLQDGFQIHQASFKHKIVLNVYDGVGKDIRESARSRFDTSNKNFRGMTGGDWLSVVLAHEFLHGMKQHRRGMRSRGRMEAGIDDRLIEMVKLGKANPWKGVITLTQR